VGGIGEKENSEEGRPVCDEFDSGVFDEVFCGGDVVCIFREDIVDFDIVQEICQYIALPSMPNLIGKRWISKGKT
jgi:hypothetical protein